MWKKSCPTSKIAKNVALCFAQSCGPIPRANLHTAINHRIFPLPQLKQHRGLRFGKSNSPIHDGSISPYENIIERLPQRWRDDCEVLKYYKNLCPWQPTEYHGGCTIHENLEADNEEEPLTNCGRYCQKWQKNNTVQRQRDYHQKRDYTTGKKPPLSAGKPTGKKSDTTKEKSKTDLSASNSKLAGPFARFYKFTSGKDKKEKVKDKIVEKGKKTKKKVIKGTEKAKDKLVEEAAKTKDKAVKSATKTKDAAKEKVSKLKDTAKEKAGKAKSATPVGCGGKQSKPDKKESKSVDKQTCKSSISASKSSCPEKKESTCKTKESTCKKKESTCKKKESMCKKKKVVCPPKDPPKIGECDDNDDEEDEAGRKRLKYITPAGKIHGSHFCNLNKMKKKKPKSKCARSESSCEKSSKSSCSEKLESKSCENRSKKSYSCSGASRRSYSTISSIRVVKSIEHSIKSEKSSKRTKRTKPKPTKSGSTIGPWNKTKNGQKKYYSTFATSFDTGDDCDSTGNSVRPSCKDQEDGMCENSRTKLFKAAEHDVLKGLNVLKKDPDFKEEVQNYFGDDYANQSYYLYKKYTFNDLLVHLQDKRGEPHLEEVVNKIKIDDDGRSGDDISACTEND